MVDIQYYDLTLYNDQSFNIPAQVFNRNQRPIVDNPSEYYGSITRFTVDANWPLFLPTIPDPLFPLTTNMSITLTYNNTPFQSFVSITADEAKRGIFDFNLFLSDLNEASEISFTAMKLAFPAAPGVNPPFFSLDPTSGLISMYLDSGWLDSNVTPNLIWFNSPLQDILNLPANIRAVPPQPNGQDYQIAVKSYAPLLPPAPRSTYPFALSTLTGDLLQVSQEYVQLSSFSDIRSILFTTNQLPIVPEFTPINGNTVQGGQTQTNFLPIITDFILTREDSKPRDSSFVYYPTAEYRRFCFTSNTPLTAIDTKAYFTTYDNRLFELLLPPGGSFSM